MIDRADHQFLALDIALLSVVMSGSGGTGRSSGRELLLRFAVDRLVELPLMANRDLFFDFRPRRGPGGLCRNKRAERLDLLENAASLPAGSLLNRPVKYMVRPAERIPLFFNISQTRFRA